MDNEAERRVRRSCMALGGVLGDKKRGLTRPIFHGHRTSVHWAPRESKIFPSSAPSSARSNLVERLNPADFPTGTDLRLTCGLSGPRSRTMICAELPFIYALKSKPMQCSLGS